VTLGAAPQLAVSGRLLLTYASLALGTVLDGWIMHSAYLQTRTRVSWHERGIAMMLNTEQWSGSGSGSGSELVIRAGITDHDRGAARPLLCRLEEQDHGARQLRLPRLEQLRSCAAQSDGVIPASSVAVSDELHK